MLNASFGWALADSKNPAYADVSNPTLGFWALLYVDHKKFGQIYIDRREIAGYTFGEPKATTSREANARIAYRKNFQDRWSLEIFGEKRSFHFGAFEIPDLYEKARRIGFEVAYKF